MEPRFMASTKNKPILVLHNFKYTHYVKNNRQVSHWRCAQYHKGCRAQIKTYNNKIVSTANPIHNHGLTSSATAPRPRPISTTTSKAKTNLAQKIAILQKLLNAKSANNKAFNKKSIKKTSNSSKNSSKKKNRILPTKMNRIPASIYPTKMNRIPASIHPTKMNRIPASIHPTKVNRIPASNLPTKMNRIPASNLLTKRRKLVYTYTTKYSTKIKNRLNG
jgi:hypothetical protein